MTVTVVSTAQLITLLPSTTTGSTPPMGVGIAGQNKTIDLNPD